MVKFGTILIAVLVVGFVLGMMGFEESAIILLGIIANEQLEANLNE